MGQYAAIFFAILISLVLWLAPIFLAAWMFKRKGYSPHWTWFGIVPLVGLIVLCICLLLPDKRSKFDALGPASQPHLRSTNPNLLLVYAPIFACALTGSVSFGDGSLLSTASAPAAIIGGCLGLVLGLVLYFDHRAVQQRIDSAIRSDAACPGDVAQIDASAAPPSNAVAVIMLVLPLVTGVLFWQAEALHLTVQTMRLLGGATVISTAILGYVDLRFLLLRRGKPLPGDQRLSPPVAAVVGMLALWLFAYPVHFLARRRLGATNLVVPALISTAVFLVPVAQASFADPALPTVGSPDVVTLVTKLSEEAPANQARRAEMGKLEVREPVEVSFDKEKQRRVARAKLASQLGEEDIFYTVEWHDRKKGMFSVQVFNKQP
jgi:hypothetical protein